MAKLILQKFIVDSGFCSRRQATELIRAGKVTVNGEVAEPGMKVFSNDDVRIGKKRLPGEPEKIYLIINKPDGYVCTNRTFTGEKNVYDLLLDRQGEKAYPKQRLFVVGRLDKNSRGLVLITNDGDMAQRVSHPRFGHEKVYAVKLRMTNDECQKNKDRLIKNLVKGVDIGEGDGVVRAKKAEYLGENKFKVILTQGVKRQIRRMFKTLGIEVIDLKRTRIGCTKCGIELGDLRCGRWRKLKLEEIEKLQES